MTRSSNSITGAGIGSHYDGCQSSEGADTTLISRKAPRDAALVCQQMTRVLQQWVQILLVKRNAVLR